MTSPKGAKSSRVRGAAASRRPLMPSSRCMAPEPEAADAAVRDDVEADMGDGSDIGNRGLEVMHPGHLQLLLLPQDPPEQRLGHHGLLGAAVPSRCLSPAALVLLSPSSR